MLNDEWIYLAFIIEDFVSETNKIPLSDQDDKW